MTDGPSMRFNDATGTMFGPRFMASYPRSQEYEVTSRNDSRRPTIYKTIKKHKLLPCTRLSIKMIFKLQSTSPGNHYAGIILDSTDTFLNSCDVEAGVAIRFFCPVFAQR